jgi:hypothetical protein
MNHTGVLVDASPRAAARSGDPAIVVEGIDRGPVRSIAS